MPPITVTTEVNPASGRRLRLRHGPAPVRGVADRGRQRPHRARRRQRHRPLHHGAADRVCHLVPLVVRREARHEMPANVATLKHRLENST
jgi:hypothetical protein